jgi:hypothetical protein
MKDKKASRTAQLSLSPALQLRYLHHAEKY